MRKEYLDGKLRADPAGGAAAANSAPPNPLGAMEGGMKTQMIGMVTQFGTMCAWGWAVGRRGEEGLELVGASLASPQFGSKRTS